MPLFVIPFIINFYTFMTGENWIKISLLTILMSTGCSTNVSVPPNNGTNKDRIKLKSGEFRVVRSIRGTASCSYLFWIDIPKEVMHLSSLPSIPLISIALGNQHLHELAMKDLTSKHTLRGKSQILHKFVKDISVANYLGLYAIVTVTISAEVIEFNEKKER